VAIWPPAPKPAALEAVATAPDSAGLVPATDSGAAPRTASDVAGTPVELDGDGGVGFDGGVLDGRLFGGRLPARCRRLDLLTYVPQLSAEGGFSQD
jgi:hypothetical protein